MLSDSAKFNSALMRATSSPGIIRSFSPAANSVLNIIGSPVVIQAASACPLRFLNPNTATEGRALTPESDEGNISPARDTMLGVLRK